MLKGALKPWAPSHSVRTTQEWLKNEVFRFIFNAHWTPKSTDANPLDFYTGGFLKSKVGTKKYKNVDQLKKALRRQWDKIPQSYFRTACDGFIDRLNAIIRAKGGQIE